MLAEEIADYSVTEAKLADNAVTTPKLKDNAVTGAKLGIQAVTLNKLSFTIVKTGVASLGPHTAVEQFVAANVGDTENTLYFPTVRLDNAGGTGKASVEASIVYQQASGSSNIDIGIRLVNHGSADVNAVWGVKTFAGGFHP